MLRQNERNAEAREASRAAWPAKLQNEFEKEHARQMVQ